MVLYCRDSGTGGQRFVTGNHCLEHGNTEINMKKLNWEPLEERRAKIKLNMFYKARTGLVEVPFDQKTIRSARRAGSYAIPASTINSHLYSFYPNTIRMWNSLPVEGKSAKNLDTFVSFLNHHTVRSSY